MLAALMVAAACTTLVASGVDAVADYEQTRGVKDHRTSEATADAVSALSARPWTGRRLGSSDSVHPACDVKGRIVLLRLSTAADSTESLPLLESLRSYMSMQAGQPVEAYAATSIAMARAQWPGIVRGANMTQGTRQAVIVLPTMKVVMSDNAVGSEAVATLANLMQTLKGPHLTMLATLPVAEQSAASQVGRASDAAARAGSASSVAMVAAQLLADGQRSGPPAVTTRTLRIAARLGGAVFLDTSRALLSAGHVAGGLTRLLGGLLASALVSLCNLEPQQQLAVEAKGPRQIGTTAGRDGHAGGGDKGEVRSGAAVERCAVCFSGWLGVSVANGGASLATNLIAPLRAEVLLALTYSEHDGCNSATSCALEQRWPALRPFAAVDVSPMVSTPTLRAVLEALPHWQQVMAAYSHPRSAVHCELQNGTAGGGGAPANNSAYKCRGIYLGNTIFAPVLGSPKLHVLRQLHDIHRCLNLVGRRERHVGIAYDRIVHTRLEFVWLRPHPPLSLLAPRVVWVPLGEDYYGGINDRHAVLPREAAEIYMRR